jgi:hypothetical protein
VTNSTRLRGLTLLVLLLAPAVLLAQDRARASWLAPLPLLGSEEDARLQLGTLLGEAAAGSRMSRSASSLFWEARGTANGISVLAPQLRVLHNSALPHSLNEGALWAGRGESGMVTAGLALSRGPVRIVLAPQVTVAANARFQTIPYPQNAEPARSQWANPFHPAPGATVDAPLRFGDQRLARVVPGQSAIEVDAPGVVVKLGTENLWWGPALRHAVTLSSHAEGFPHLSVRARTPWRTRVGQFDGQWLFGQLRESDFFDDDRSNDRRALSGAMLTYRPRADSLLTLAVARLVMAPWGVSEALGVLRSVGAPDTTADASPREQITTLMARWAVPAVGTEVYAEWARFAEPRSLSDLLEFPGYSQGYTLGVQWARPLTVTRQVAVQAELSMVEPDASLRLRPVNASYTSRGVPHGWTHRGRTLGASTGVGSSAQWVAADLYEARWRVGLYAGRIRWDNAALWTDVVPAVKNEDISMYAGVRASGSWRGVRLLVDYTHAARLGYLFQDKIKDPERGTHEGVDFVNRTLALTLSMPVGR